uniref:Uncharacterized protein n=1 Tax=Rhizophora mucronata TaxID=61149 RepID=A0A2P2NNG7_RHIMU
MCTGFNHSMLKLSQALNLTIDKIAQQGFQN